MYGQTVCTKDVSADQEETAPIQAECRTGQARVVNRGTVQVHDGSSSATDGISAKSLISAEARNTGTVTESAPDTSGSVFPIGVHAVTEPIANYPIKKNAQARAYNSGTIELNSAVATGLQAEVVPGGVVGQQPANADATWKARAENTGDITVNGDGQDIGSNPVITIPSYGISAGIRSSNYGVAEIVTSGMVKATGTGAIALRAYVGGNGQAKISVTGGSVEAGTLNQKTGEAAIEAEVNIGALADPEDDNDVEIIISGDARVRTHSDGNDFPVAIKPVLHSPTPEKAHALVEIRDSAWVRAIKNANEFGWAVDFRYGSKSRSTLRLAGRRSAEETESAWIQGGVAFNTENDVFELDRGVVNGNVYFFDGNDRMEIKNWGRVYGTMDFGVGDDEFTVSTTRGARIGGVKNLETLRIEKGSLIFYDHVNLGSSGIVTIQDAGRLVFQIWENAAGELKHGTLTAGELNFEGGAPPEIFAQFRPLGEGGTTDAKITEWKGILRNSHLIGGTGGLQVLTVTTVTSSGETVTGTLTVKSRSDSGSETETGELSLSDGRVKFIEDAIESIGSIDLSTREPDVGGRGGTSGTSTGGSGSGSGSESAVLGAGLIALLFNIFGDEEASEAQYGGFSVVPSAVAKGGLRQGIRLTRAGPARSDRGPWVRSAKTGFASYGTDRLEASGSRIGWDFHRSDDHFLRTELVPNAYVTPAGGRRGSAAGQRFSLSSIWQSNNRHVSLGISHGRYDVDSRFYDSLTRGWLAGRSALASTQGTLSAGLSSELNDIRVSAGASLFAGEVRQESFKGENAVMTLQMPEHKQRYSGLRLNLSMRSQKWLQRGNGMSFKPHLKVSMTRTRSAEPDAVMLRQSDRAGVLSIDYPRSVRSVPLTLNTLSFGVDVKPSGNGRGRWRFGFAGMEVDGDAEYAAIAAYRMRF